MPTIGQNIRAARVAAGLKTQGALAARLKVQQPQLSDWENDRYGTPDVSTLLKIAAAIPCPIDALVQGVDAQYDTSRDLLSHTSTKPSLGANGGLDVSTSARVLQERLARDRTLASQIETIAGDLTDIAVRLREKTTGAGAAPPARRAGGRKTG